MNEKSLRGNISNNRTSHLKHVIIPNEGARDYIMIHLCCDLHPKDSNESTFGITSIFSAVGALIMALYVDTGYSTFVTILVYKRVIKF